MKIFKTYAIIDQDSDGLGVRRILDLLYKNKEIDYTHTSVRKLPVTISNLYNKVHSESISEVIIADLSIEHVYKDILKVWVKFKFKLVYIDHHPGFDVKILERVAYKYGLKLELIYSQEYSACMNLYKAKKNDLNIPESQLKKLDRFIDIINRFDTNVLDNKMLYEVGMYLNNYIFEFGISNAIYNINEETIFGSRFKEYIISEKEKVNRYFKNLEEKELVLKDDKLVILFQDKYFSNTQFVYPDFTIYIMITEWNSYYIRIRSDYNHDKLIAMKDKFIRFIRDTYGVQGGGHAHAFSVTFPNDYNGEQLKPIIEKLVEIYKEIM